MAKKALGKGLGALISKQESPSPISQKTAPKKDTAPGTHDNDVRMVKALTPIDDFNQHFDTKFDDKEFDTIGGIVIQHFGRVPECDEAITINDWRFKVVNGTGRRINLMEVTPVD